MSQELPTFEIHSDSFKEVIVVGGGTCGLSVCARLCERCPASIFTEDEHQRVHWLHNRGAKVDLIKRRLSNTKYGMLKKPDRYVQKNFAASDLLVLDAFSDKFMAQWDSQFEAFRIPFLRSPMFFHLDPQNVDGLVSYSHMNGREKDLKEIKNVVGKEYSKHQLKKLTKKKMKEKRCPAPSEQDDFNHDRPGLIDINMRDWKDYYRPSTKLFHEFCHDIINKYQLKDIVKKDRVVNIQYGYIEMLDTNQTGKGFLIETESGNRFGCKACITACGHEGKPAYPIAPFVEAPHYPYGSCHTSHIIKKQVCFPSPELIKKVKQGKQTKVVIVGGGLTSAQLADTAIKEGVGKVYLVLRSNLKIKHFDFHLDWVTKFRNVKKMSFYLKDTDEERFQMIQEAREGGSVNPEYYKIIMNHIQSGKLEVHMYTNIVDQLWNAELNKWDLRLESRDETSRRPRFNEKHQGTWSLDEVDYICFATGMQADIHALPCFKSLMESHPIRTVNGLPCLTDNLQWNDEVPLFMVGKYAGLRTGPASANLDGARLGAERIGWFIQDMRERGLFDWNIENKDIYSLSNDDWQDADASQFQLSSLEKRMQLASGQMNWYSLLQEA